MAQVAFIASGQAQLDGAAGTVTVVNPGITANSIVLIGTGTALNEAGAGLHLVAIPQAGRVVFTSVDGAGFSGTAYGSGSFWLPGAIAAPTTTARVALFSLIAASAVFIAFKLSTYNPILSGTRINSSL